MTECTFGFVIGQWKVWMSENTKNSIPIIEKFSGQLSSLFMFGTSKELAKNSEFIEQFLVFQH